MHDNKHPADNEEWVIWNGFYGVITLATIGRVEVGTSGKNAWLDDPFDMVGPFSLDELETYGRIGFEACIVMSRQRWQEDQVELRREGLATRRATHERLNERNARFNQRQSWQQAHPQQNDESKFRETLKLPVDGKLKPSQIKAAYRQLAQKMHPDVGGSHEQFLRIAEARKVLLEYIS